MNRLLTSRLTAHTEARQIEASNLADAAALAVDAAFANQWRRIIATLNTPIIATAQFYAFRELLAILPAAKASVADSLRKIARWGHTTARRSLRTTLPLGYLQSAVIVNATESLMEDTGPGDRPGILELILRSMGGDEQTIEARIRSLLSPGISVNEKKDVYLDYLFPPPPPAVVDEIVYAPVNGRTWEQRLEGATRTSATPAQLADVVAQGMAQGKSQRQIAKDLLPVVDGVRSSARRIARTEALRVAGQIQERAWNGLGDMVVGLQVRNPLDERTRPAHRLRHGTIYYKDPKPGQKSLAEAPHPPVEPDGTLAYNCRCVMVPELATPDYLDDAAKKLFADKPSFRNDPATYAEWFANADEKSRRLAVGTRRYEAARAVTGAERPSYHVFVDPTQPDAILSANAIRSETPTERHHRMAVVGRLVDERRGLIRRVERLGLA